MCDSAILMNLINGSATINLENHYSKKKVVLVEHGTTGSQLEILNVPDDAVVIDVDSNFENQRIFSGASDECKRADYIIICESKNVVVFIEMKKGNPATSDIVKQLKGSFCLFEYFQVIAREFLNRNNFLSSYEKRFVAFKNVNLDKRQTKIDKSGGSHSSPENLLKVTWAQQIQFNMIAA